MEPNGESQDNETEQVPANGDGETETTGDGIDTTVTDNNGGDGGDNETDNDSDSTDEETDSEETEQVAAEPRNAATTVSKEWEAEQAKLRGETDAENVSIESDEESNEENE